MNIIYSDIIYEYIVDLMHPINSSRTLIMVDTCGVLIFNDCKKAPQYFKPFEIIVILDKKAL